QPAVERERVEPLNRQSDAPEERDPVEPEIPRRRHQVDDEQRPVHDEENDKVLKEILELASPLFLGAPSFIALPAHPATPATTARRRLEYVDIAVIIAPGFGEICPELVSPSDARARGCVSQERGPRSATKTH